MRVRVVTDSTADMDEAEAARLGIVQVSLNVHWNGETYRDKAEISADEFYRKLRQEKGTPRTSQPSAGQFEEVYRGLLKEAESIISIHISGGLSGTLNSARVAALNVAPDRIAVLDSLMIATALGWQAVRIARLAGEGASLSECRALGADLIARSRLFCAFDTLEFLRRGGRIGRVQAIAGGLLAVKPIIHLVEGEIVPADRVRTRSAAVKRMAELMARAGPMEQVAVMYADDPAPAEQMVPLLPEGRSGLPVTVGRIGPVVGTHVGPGAFGACGILVEDRS